MSKVERTVALSAPAAEVWGLIGGFDSLPAWHPGAAACTLHDVDGETRRVIELKGAGGATITERLVDLDDAGMSCTYAIIESPLPVADYESTIVVRTAGGGCEVHWSSTFEPAGAPAETAEAAVAGIYDAGLGALKERFG